MGNAFEEKIEKIKADIVKAVSGLIGQKVIHNRYGEGVLNAITDGRAEIVFASGEKRVFVADERFFDYFKDDTDELTRITAEIVSLEKKLLLHAEDEKLSAEVSSYGRIFVYPETLPPLPTPPASIIENSRMPSVKLNATVNGYYAYLRYRGYKEWTPSGLPSTVWQYIVALDEIHDIEKMSFEEMYENIDALVKDYDENGAKENLGKTQHSTWINALRRLQDFKDYIENYS